MYTEFIITFIGLGVAISLGVTNLILLIVLLKRSDNSKPMLSGYMAAPQQMPQQSTMSQTSISSGHVVFCKKCATQFDASQKCCPNCGTMR